MLARIEHEKICETTERRAAMQPHVRPSGTSPLRKRHMLVVGLVCRCTPKQESIAWVEVLRAIVRVVVLYLVIIPRDDPCKSCVRGLQVRVALVEGITVAIFIERIRLSRTVRAH